MFYYFSSDDEGEDFKSHDSDGFNEYNPIYEHNACNESEPCIDCISKNILKYIKLVDEIILQIMRNGLFENKAISL